MADSSVNHEAAAGSRPPKTVYGQLVCEIAVLECVRAALSEWDLAGQPTGSRCHVGSAELALREAIDSLNNLTSAVHDIENQSREVTHG
jgi:hypothetical protein